MSRLRLFLGLLWGIIVFGCQKRELRNQFKNLSSFSRKPDGFIKSGKVPKFGLLELSNIELYHQEKSFLSTKSNTVLY